jgi:hypothetical protein
MEVGQNSWSRFYSVFKLTRPSSLARPAFDCRGSLAISFSKINRVINIRYDHTSLHKTVLELSEFFAPPAPKGPVAVPVETEKPVKEKPVKAKTPRPSKKRDTLEGQGSSSRPRKRTKKNTTLEVSGASPAIAMAPIDTNLTQMQPDQGTNITTTTAPTPELAVQQKPSAYNLVQISPAEAARRKETASRILAEAGVDPQTLSEDQFNIFSNQSPDLQKESLAMLVKYGAERLRIVHPPKEGSNSEASIPSRNHTPNPSIPPLTSDQHLETTNAGGGDQPPVELSSLPSSTKKPRRLGKSRVACGQCKSSRTKVPPYVSLLLTLV